MAAPLPITKTGPRQVGSEGCGCCEKGVFAQPFITTLPDALPYSYALINRDLDRMDKAVQAFNPAADWQIHNFGEWWMIWLEIYSAHMEHEKTIFQAKCRIAAAAPEAQRLEEQRKELQEFVGRVTYHILRLRDAPSCSCVRQSVFLKLRDIFIQFTSRLREHILAAQAMMLPAWEVLSHNEKHSVYAAMNLKTMDIAQWWTPWYSNEFNDDQYLEILNAMPCCCGVLEQMPYHRYFRPQWRSRIDPLITSIYDPEHIVSPTAKRAPNIFWCCFGYDDEDPHAPGFCLSVPKFRLVPYKSHYVAPPPAPKPLPPPPAPKPSLRFENVVIREKYAIDDSTGLRYRINPDGSQELVGPASAPVSPMGSRPASMVMATPPVVASSPVAAAASDVPKKDSL